MHALLCTAPDLARRRDALTSSGVSFHLQPGQDSALAVAWMALGGLRVLHVACEHGQEPFLQMAVARCLAVGVVLTEVGSPQSCRLPYCWRRLLSWGLRHAALPLEELGNARYCWRAAGCGGDGDARLKEPGVVLVGSRTGLAAKLLRNVVPDDGRCVVVHTGGLGDEFAEWCSSEVVMVWCAGAEARAPRWVPPENVANGPAELAEVVWGATTAAHAPVRHMPPTASDVAFEVTAAYDVAAESARQEAWLLVSVLVAWVWWLWAQWSA